MNFEEAVQLIAEKAKKEGVKFVLKPSGRILTERSINECPLIFLTDDRRDYDNIAARDYGISYKDINRIMCAADDVCYADKQDRVFMEVALLGIEQEC